MRIGVISDTHGLLRPEVLAQLADVEHIVHAGDLGTPEVLERLRALAPVTAVWGNVDGPELRRALPEVTHVELEGSTVVVAHLRDTALAAAAHLERPGLVVFGHSHRALVERRERLVLLNPGSAGPRRFRLRVTIAFATIVGREIDAEIVHVVS
jgi:putative phosphoesterase